MSAETLIDKMRRAREQGVDAAGHRFTVRIPNDGELEDLGEHMAGKRLTFRRVALAFTVDWNLKELDLIPGGGPEPVPFAAPLFEEWLNSHEAGVEPLFKAITDGIAARREQKAADEKN